MCDRPCDQRDLTLATSIVSSGGSCPIACRRPFATARGACTLGLLPYLGGGLWLWGDQAATRGDTWGMLACPVTGTVFHFHVWSRAVQARRSAWRSPL